MITDISFKNYKLFKEQQTLVLKPLTILIGKNNTGKSALLKLLPLLEGSLSTRFDHPIDLNNNEVSLGEFPKDLIYGQSNKELEFEIKQLNWKNENEFLKVGLYVQDDEFKISQWNCNNIIDLELDSADNNSYLNKKTSKVINAKFQGFNLKSMEYNDELLQLPKFSLNSDYIGGIRQKAETYYTFNNIITEKSAADGSNLYNFLIEDSQTTNKKYFTLVSNWLKEKFEGWELRIEYDGYRKDLPARIFLEKDTLKVNLSQTGMGISQILPLIIRAYKPCSKETVIVLEEPEAHLHPYAHAQIAQLFFESVDLDKNKKYLIETHSQNFVLRLRRLVAEGKLRPDDLNIYYVDYDEDQNFSELKPIVIDEFGKVDWWPDVFGETLQEASAIRTAQIDKGNVD
ncbi:DUF3696 domain-containing protein [Chryseobacterium sp. Bi04]|uniref:AAA family ATPase n=1 Tax=Chryseobacterium sp. Bi04 TaxID=2822345 RepID=UPI001DC66A77|nr:DUF3696 domain-containing protein [Chryseobacterium sp. Bi04]CAH0195561.1 hypothetical protein SRABI04_01849 [Chryseobacterium sp. Bi04]